MAESAQVRKLTVEEYLEFEKSSDVRHEFIGGLIFAMTGDSRRHGDLAYNLECAARDHLRGGSCRVSSRTIRVRIEHLDIYYYPDVVVTRDALDKARYEIKSPLLIIEILSPTTEGVDRREKRFNYAQIPSLQEYVLVSQDTRRVEVLRREADWLADVVEDGGTVEFRSIGLNLPVAAIYEDIVT
jgi:Uma2 family endonuclease